MLGVTGRNPEIEERYPELRDIGDAMDAEVDRIWRESASQLSRIADQYQDLVKQCQLMDKLKENNDL
jgi:transcription elongation GreA/GreB family factor